MSVAPALTAFGERGVCQGAPCCNKALSAPRRDYKLSGEQRALQCGGLCPSVTSAPTVALSVLGGELLAVLSAPEQAALERSTFRAAGGGTSTFTKMGGVPL